MSEVISQLIDRNVEDECQDSLFDSICSDDSLSKAWANYHLIGNVMRGEVSSAGRDLSGVISNRLADEPTVLAPKAIETAVLGRNMPDKDLWKPVSMLALAASIALMAVFIVNPINNEKPSNDSNLASTNTKGSNSISQEQKFANEFDEMLAGHGEFTSTSGLNGLVTYAKLVSNQQLEQ